MNETVKPEADAVAEPTVEVEGEQDDGLDKLLKEWPESPEETPPEKAPAQSQDDIVAAVEARLTAKQDYGTFLNDFKSAVSDLPFDVKLGLIDGFVNERAKANSKLNAAYLQRHSDPAGWEKVFAKLTDEFKGQFAVKESTADADREAAVAFVRGSSTKEVPEPPISDSDLSKMSDAEFAEYERKEFGI